MAGSQIPRPPAGLGARGKALWRSIHTAYELDAIEVELLEELCRALDCCDRIRRELEGEESLQVLGSAGQWRVTPLLTSLENQVKLVDRLASSLGVSMPGSGAGKPRGHQAKAVRTRWARAAKGAPGSVTSIVGA